MDRPRGFDWLPEVQRRERGRVIRQIVKVTVIAALLFAWVLSTLMGWY